MSVHVVYVYMDTQYVELVQHVLQDGETRPDRTGVGVISVWSPPPLRFDLTDHRLPLLQVKHTVFRLVAEELLWMLRGETNVRSLEQRNVRIWSAWANEQTGELGPVYGKQWRRWNETVDQWQQLIEGLRREPYGRRHVLSAWNVAELADMALPPCHMMAQFYVSGEKQLHCHMYQRSCDVGLGLPFNVAQYALMTHVLAHLTGYEAASLTVTLGDAHIYQNHRTPLQACVQRWLEQEEEEDTNENETRVFIVEPFDTVEQLSVQSFLVKNYRGRRAVKLPIAV